jgi:photosystem II stability/assembly factor-like uncharacterized protein
MIGWTRALAATLGLLVAGSAHAEWRAIDLPRKDVTLRAVAVEGAGRFSVSGSKGTFATTADGGRSWRLADMPGAESLDFRGHASAGGALVAMSAGPAEEGRAKLFRSADGGVSWTLAHETKDTSAFFDTLALWDEANGLVLGDPVGGAWFLLRTQDGGRTWTRVKAKMPPLKPGEAAFAASNSALFLGRPGEAFVVSGGAGAARVFRSADFGRTWKVAETPVAANATSGLFGGLALGGRRAVAVGGDYKAELSPAGGIAVSDDGGASWTLATTPGRLMEGVGRLNARTLIAVGPRGTLVSRDNGRTWSQTDDQGFHAIACAHGTCVAAGPKGHVAVWR